MIETAARYLRGSLKAAAFRLMGKDRSEHGLSHLPLRTAPLLIRPAGEQDIADLDRIQKAAPEAVLWDAHSYLAYACRVAELDGRVAGFIVTRTLGEQESEILSLVVDRRLRRRGIASQLMADLLSRASVTWFLEVRESNWPARRLYAKLGFEEVALRAGYYQDNGETAVVMRRRSC